jgi:hypothetical protein
MAILGLPASVDVGFRPHAATIFLCCQRKMVKETRPELQLLGQPLSVLQPTKQLIPDSLLQATYSSIQTSFVACRKL